MQSNSEDVARFINTEYSDAGCIIHYYPYLNIVMGRDPFDWKRYKTLFKSVIESHIPGNSIVVWDDWDAVMDGKVNLDMLQENETLEFVRSFDTIDENGDKRSLVIFKTIEWQ